MALRKILSVFGRLGIVALLAVAFTFGLILTIYLSLRSPNIQVPEVVNQTYMDGETTLERAGLDIRERAKRYKPDVPPGVILDQSPRAGEVVKAGQTVAVVVSRAPREGEQAPQEDVAEKKEEKASGGGSENSSNRSENQNRARPRNTNRNVNGNANANGNLNGSNRNTGARNANLGNRNANANRNANLNRNVNTNAGALRPRTTSTNAGPGRNANAARPANANRRPNP